MRNDEQTFMQYKNKKNELGHMFYLSIVYVYHSMGFKLIMWTIFDYFHYY